MHIYAVASININMNKYSGMRKVAVKLTTPSAKRKPRSGVRAAWIMLPVAAVLCALTAYAVSNGGAAAEMISAFI